MPIVTSRRTCPTITKFFDENARESIAVKQKASSKNVILSTNHVGALTPDDNAPTKTASADDISFEGRPSILVGMRAEPEA